MNYIKEIKELLFDLFHEDWMNNEYWNEYEEFILKSSNITYEQLSEAIQIGINNGYSIEYQIELLNEILKNDKI